MARLHRPQVQASSFYSRMSCGSAASMSLVTQMCGRVTGSAREGAHGSQEGAQTGLVSPGTAAHAAHAPGQVPHLSKRAAVLHSVEDGVRSLPTKVAGPAVLLGNMPDWEHSKTPDAISHTWGA